MAPYDDYDSLNYDLWELDEPALSPKKKRRYVDNICYWQLAEQVVNTWVIYQEKKWLLISAVFPETRNAVKDALKVQYGGSLNALRNSVRFYSGRVDDALTLFEVICKDFDLESVDRQWLNSHIDIDDKYGIELLRKRIRRGIVYNKEPESFDVL